MILLLIATLSSPEYASSAGLRWRGLGHTVYWLGRQTSTGGMGAYASY